MDLGAMATSGTTAATATSGTVQPRLVKAAHDFEAMMMKELLKPMTSASEGDEESQGSGLGSGTALGEYASESLGRALSQQGGFGMANSIIKTLSKSGNLSVTDAVTKKVNDDTVIGTLK
jgi:Rod binding domain-containing protein